MVGCVQVDLVWVGLTMRHFMRLIPCWIVFVGLIFSFTQGSSVSAANALLLPAGFIDEVAYGGLLAPRAFAFLPDGRVLAVERGDVTSTNGNLASIRVFKNGALLSTAAYIVNVCGDSERGLLGIAVDPNFVSNGYIYIYYTRQSITGIPCATNTFSNGIVTGIATGPRNRISRLTMTGDIANSELVLIDSILSEHGNHNGGDLHFGADGYLYASTGDAGVSWTSPHTGTLNGKIIRILPTLTGYDTTGNPYDLASGAVSCATIAPAAPANLPGPCKEIFAKGFRNPFRFTMQPTLFNIPGSDSPFVGDVGQSTWEEVDQVQAGGDYGWPVREGFCPLGQVCSPPYQSGGYQNPIYAYLHDNDLSSAIIGGDFYIGGAQYPAQYSNNYFFAEFERGFIARLIYNPNTQQWTRPVPDFASGGIGIVGLKRGPDGNLYYVAATSLSSRIDSIHRIRYVDPANAAPPRNYFTTTTTPTLTWNQITWAIRYQVQVAMNSSFSGAAIYQAGSNLTITLPPQGNGLYYYRVAACSTALSCGAWSATETFIIAVP